MDIWTIIWANRASCRLNDALASFSSDLRRASGGEMAPRLAVAIFILCFDMKRGVTGSNVSSEKPSVPGAVELTWYSCSASFFSNAPFDPC